MLFDQTDAAPKLVRDSSCDPCEKCGMKIFDYCSSAHCESPGRRTTISENQVPAASPTKPLPTVV